MTRFGRTEFRHIKSFPKTRFGPLCIQRMNVSEPFV
ncbi:unnamed protein product [Arabidopsis halleri]